MQSAAKALILGFYAAAFLSPGVPGTAPGGLPKVAAPLTEGTWTWTGKMTMGRQTSEIAVTVAAL